MAVYTYRRCYYCGLGGVDAVHKGVDRAQTPSGEDGGMHGCEQVN